SAHGGEAVGKQMSRRHAKRDTGGLDLALRADESLGHRLLGHEEGAGDLLRAEAARRSQRQGDEEMDSSRHCTAEREKMRIEAAVRSSAKAASTLRLRHSIATGELR